MIELDFIPDWYRADRNRRVWHQRKYAIVGLVIFAIACGLMVAGRSLSQAQAKLAVLRSEFESGISQVQRYRQLQVQLEGLEKNARMLESVSPRTPYSAVLAELSCSASCRSRWFPWKMQVQLVLQGKNQIVSSWVPILHRINRPQSRFKQN
jgi:hypothetical protein